MHALLFGKPLLVQPEPATYVRDEDHAAAVHQLLHLWDTDADAVDAHFDNLGALPLGKYAEQLLFYALERDPRYEVMLTNYQVKEGNTTLGEVDVILRDTHTNGIEHWEVAVKYYVQHWPVTDPISMIGPNAKDTLHDKLQRLMQHQLPLGQHLDVLNLLGVGAVRSKVFMKGRFFYHRNNRICPPQTAHPEHDQGWWCHLNEVDDMITENYLWHVPQRYDLLAPVPVQRAAALHTASDMLQRLRQHFETETRGVFCVAMQRHEHGWEAHSWGVVVHDDWPWRPHPIET